MGVVAEFIGTLPCPLAALAAACTTSAAALARWSTARVPTLITQRPSCTWKTAASTPLHARRYSLSADQSTE